MKKSKGVLLPLMVTLLFILPFIAFLMTTYTIYLKNQMNKFDIKINDIKIKSEDIPEKNVSNSPIKDIQLIDIRPNISELKYDIKELNYYNLISLSKSSLEEVNRGAIKLFTDEQQAINEVINAYQNNIEYFITKTNDKFYVYREDYELEENVDEQFIYTIQIYYTLNASNAYLPTNTLRKAGYPVLAFNGKSTGGGKYWGILAGLFINKSDAVDFSNNMDDKQITELTGFSIEGRWYKGIRFIGQR
ncbi:hypothetical protein OF820_13170 [Oceanotoga sp. DSM 15011]|uniref:Uncharacterized protein n=1 Tax=Oceanotoga teriensis TaxID=515440 RepID=A0AA45C8P8_9BACT|nr:MULTISPECIES: hypothetical protein [Oceanotoga]MDN5342408.1 hypothetical protein [Oceanotoga sp.]MDO7975511.1 hypothetical protein [Oceanotoga teriensis]PWJ96201.1 hypothetical protein C7380_102112 [Oceanotoga teriensis]UYO99984.1 hypothetical protein OF820_13170 [Oceanotoga sp. DSM 15011]